MSHLVQRRKFIPLGHILHAPQPIIPKVQYLIDKISNPPDLLYILCDPRMSNDLPGSIKSSSSLSIFKSKLKTYLLNIFFKHLTHLNIAFFALPVHMTFLPKPVPSFLQVTYCIL